jgi:hypothetical protein
MLGFGEKHHALDPATLPIFVHALQSNDAFETAHKVWENNGRYIMQDASNRKELLRFVFSDPACVVWLERDQGRQDTFELVLLWDAAGKKENVSEVYVISAQTAGLVGDDARAKSLLSAILTSPAIVPVTSNNAATPPVQTGQN